jgi:hypothetical protein
VRTIRVGLAAEDREPETTIFPITPEAGQLAPMPPYGIKGIVKTKEYIARPRAHVLGAIVGSGIGQAM